MNWYTLKGLRLLAQHKKRRVCAWMPHGVTFKDDNIWIHDSSARIKEYEGSLGVGMYSTKIIVNPDGKVEGLNG